MILHGVYNGDYEERRMVALFTDPKAAGELADKLRGDVVEWPVDPDLSALKPFGRSVVLDCKPERTGWADETLVVGGVTFARTSDEQWLSDLDNREDYSPKSIAESLIVSIATLKHAGANERDYLYVTYVQAWGKTQAEADDLAEANLAEAILLVEGGGS